MLRRLRRLARPRGRSTPQLGLTPSRETHVCHNGPASRLIGDASRRAWSMFRPGGDFRRLPAAAAHRRPSRVTPRFQGASGCGRGATGATPRRRCEVLQAVPRWPAHAGHGIGRVPGHGGRRGGRRRGRDGHVDAAPTATPSHTREVAYANRLGLTAKPVKVSRSVTTDRRIRLIAGASRRAWSMFQARWRFDHLPAAAASAAAAGWRNDRTSSAHRSAAAPR